MRNGRPSSHSLEKCSALQDLQFKCDTERQYHNSMAVSLIADQMLELMVEINEIRG